MSEIFIGLISGTSADGIDAALVDFENGKVSISSAITQPYPDELHQRIEQLIRDQSSPTIDFLGETDTWVGEIFAEAVFSLLEESSKSPEAIIAIGSHGQTIRHKPHGGRPFSMQIGDPHVIATHTRIKTVADFRRKDIALGGEGAPLTPAFHLAQFATPKLNRAILNLGGIANLTLLLGKAEVFGFDVGPANTLLDLWSVKNIGQRFDKDGLWAESGTVDINFLKHLLDDAYFKMPPPKSTGRERFNMDWLTEKLNAFPDLDPVDVQATLSQLVVDTVATSLNTFGEIDELFICGGGVHNQHVMKALANRLSCKVETTQAIELDPDYVEAVAFAWLARETLAGRPGNLPEVTGATRLAVLGAIF
ncbi:MAG: anhydro-N-acetylmuramic acid kinase, partial [Gammaproteobacteria bacterium]